MIDTLQKVLTMKKILFGFLLFCTMPLQAQINTQDTILINLSRPLVSRLIELSASANAYSGDLGRYKNWSPMVHLGIRFNQDKRINHRLGAGIGFITGSDRFYTFRDIEGNRTTPNTFFRTQVFSFVYELEYNLIKRRNFRVYLSQGIGLFRFQTQNEARQSLLDLSSTRPFDESYGNIALQLPTGIGVMYLFRNGFGLGGYLGVMNTQTDYLDNISAWGTQSGNDNVLRARFSVLVPLRKEPTRQFPAPRKLEFYPYETVID